MVDSGSLSTVRSSETSPERSTVSTPAAAEANTPIAPVSGKPATFRRRKSRPLVSTSASKRQANAHLKEWIDGNTVHAAPPNDVEIGIAESYFKACLSVLGEIWRLAAENHWVIHTKKKCILKDCYGRLMLWIDPFTPGQLDHILTGSEELKEHIFDLLTKVATVLAQGIVPLAISQPSANGEHHRNLQEGQELRHYVKELSTLVEQVKSNILVDVSDDSGSDTSSSDDETQSRIFEVTLRKFTSATDGLMDLMPSLQRRAKIIKDAPLNGRFEHTRRFEVSGPAHPFVSHIVDKFKLISMTLAERLGQANWERHLRLRDVFEPDTDLASHVVEDDPVAKSLFQPHSMFHDSGLGSSKPAVTEYASSNASHTSFLSELEDGCRTILRVPDTPAEVGLGKPFECSICRRTLSNIRNRIDYKIHVFADLQPYICTWPECRDTLTTYPTKKLWGKHEFSRHRIESVWTCNHCLTELYSPAECKTHLNDIHGQVISEGSSKLALNFTTVTRPLIQDNMRCPICAGSAGSTQKAYETHVARHMEEIALICLPREGTEETDSSSVTDGSVTSQPTSPLHQANQPSLSSGLAIPPPTPSLSTKPKLTCNSCARTFERACDLRKHSKRHLKPYGCTQDGCKESFGSKADWKNHENEVHFCVKGWRCPKDISATTTKSRRSNPQPCNRFFYRLESFTDHLQTKHMVNDDFELNALGADHDFELNALGADHDFELNALGADPKAKMGRDRHTTFWCGYCRKIVELKMRGDKGNNERFDHIDRHIIAGKNMSHWLPLSKRFDVVTLLDSEDDEQQRQVTNVRESQGNVVGAKSDPVSTGKATSTDREAVREENSGSEKDDGALPTSPSLVNVAMEAADALTEACFPLFKD